MCQADFRFLPLQFLALALVWLGAVRLYDGHHPAVHFDDHHNAAAGLRGPDPGRLASLEYLLGVSFGNAPNGALAQNDAVVLHQFVHHLSEGLVSAKVSDRSL
jgi:hypothetical protein